MSIGLADRSKSVFVSLERAGSIDIFLCRRNRDAVDFFLVSTERLIASRIR